MKVIVIDKTPFGVVQYNDVTSISKSGSLITISYGTSSSVVVNSTQKSVYIIES